MVINKIDHLDPADRDEAVRFVRSALRDLLGEAEPELFVISAREHDGLAPLVARLWRLAAHERVVLLLRSAAGLARSAAADIAQAPRFEAHAIALPLEELASKARRFEDRIGELTAASAEAEDLLARGSSARLPSRSTRLSPSTRVTRTRACGQTCAGTWRSLARPRRASSRSRSKPGSRRPCEPTSRVSCRASRPRSPSG